MIYKNRILFTLILIFIVTYILLRIFIYKSESLLYEYSGQSSINLITSLINKSISENISNKELISIDRNSNNEIVDLNINNYELNNILYNFNTTLLSNINHFDDKYSIFYIPSGIINTLPIFINLSPKIPFKIRIIGSTDNETYSDIRDYGINNSIIEVGINVNINIQVILPFEIENKTISKKIVLDSKIIQGSVPSYYSNRLLNGE